jgi:hypothetical protein
MINAYLGLVMQLFIEQPCQGLGRGFRSPLAANGFRVSTH